MCIFNKKLKNHRGFSLVELMIVVAIIGVLATVAVPAFNNFLTRARRSEVKSTLGAMHTAEKAYHAEHLTYHDNLVTAGFTPEGTYNYNIGFGDQASVSANSPNVPSGVPGNFGATGSNLFTMCAANTACTLTGTAGGNFEDLENQGKVYYNTNGKHNFVLIAVGRNSDNLFKFCMDNKGKTAEAFPGGIAQNCP